MATKAMDLAQKGIEAKVYLQRLLAGERLTPKQGELLLGYVVYRATQPGTVAQGTTQPVAGD